MQNLPKLKAQSILEYSIAVGCVVAALIAMQIYIKRGIEGRLKQTADEIGEQYAPENITTDITNTLTSTQIDESETEALTYTYPADYPDPALAGTTQVIKDSYGLPAQGIRTTVTIDNETMKRSGSEKLGEFEDKLFK